MLSSVRTAWKSRTETGPFPCGARARVFRMSGILPRRIVGQTAALVLWLITFGLCLSNRSRRDAAGCLAADTQGRSPTISSPTPRSRESSSS